MTPRARLLESVGERVQVSVFKCHLGPDAVDRLLRSLRRRLDPREDRLTVYRLCDRCADAVVHVGTSRPAEPIPTFWVVSGTPVPQPGPAEPVEERSLSLSKSGP